MKEIEEIRQNYCTCEQDRKCSTCYVTEEICSAVAKNIKKIMDKSECDCWMGLKDADKFDVLIDKLNKVTYV